MHSAVKIGILINGDTVPLWLASAIERLRDSDYAEFPLILNPQSHSKVSSGNTHAASTGVCPVSSSAPSSGFKYAGFRFYEKLDARLKRRQPAYDHPVAVRQLLPGAEILEYPLMSAASQDKQLEAINKIADSSIDFFLDAGSALPGGEPGKYAKLGVWRFCNANGVKFNQQPNGFHELTTGAATTAIALQMEDEAKGQTLQISMSTHLPDILLLGRQRHRVMMQAASQLVLAVKRLHKEGAKSFSQRIAAQNKFECKKTSYPYPNNWRLLWRLFVHAARYTRLKIRKLFFFEQWCLLIKGNNNEYSPADVSLHEFREIYPPAERIWADPFVVTDDNDPGKFHIFIEEMEYSVGHGHISVLTVDSDGNHNGAVPVIKQPYHMSFPFVFNYQNEKYMIPETGDNRTIQLYRCVDFPHHWEFVKNLMEDVFAVDTHVEEVNGRWWMFTTIRESEHTDCLDQLHLFHADSPLSGQWQPHVNNPVSMDVRSARPAGALVRHDGKIFRPSQDGGYHYGWGIKINEILQLDDDQYLEQEVRTIESGWRRSIIATHTLNHVKGMTVSDARVLRPRWLSWIRKRLDS